MNDIVVAEILLDELAESAMQIPSDTGHDAGFIVPTEVVKKIREYCELKLLPCPCCGGTAEFQRYEPTIGEAVLGWFVRCQACEMLRTTKIDIGCSKSSAAKCWNKRTVSETTAASDG